MKSKKKNKIVDSISHKNLLRLLIVLNVIVGGIFIAVAFTINSKEINTRFWEQEFKVKVERESILRTTEEVLADTAVERAKLDTYFVDKDGIVPLLQDIELLGEDAGVTVVFDSVQVNNSDGTEKLDLRIISEGEFDDIYYFLSFMELLPVKLSFEKVFVERKRAHSENADALWRGTFVVTISSYLEIEDEVLR